jgi:hypothetical protein
MKKEKVVERVLDYIRNQEFYEALFKEIEADIRRYQAKRIKKTKDSGYRHPKRQV